MQAIITAAGQSSRFYPFTDFGHKSFISVAGKPIIYHTLESIKHAGIKDVIVVTGQDDRVIKLFKENSFGLHITHIVQEKPLGMGDALIRAEKYLEKDFFVIYPHHVDFHTFRKSIEDKKESDGIVLLAKKESDLSRFGVLRVEGDRVLDLIEKPKKEEAPSNLRVIGIYLLCKKFLSTLKETPPHHYSFEEAITRYAKKAVAKVEITDKETVSFKYPWDLLSLSEYLLSTQNQRIAKNVSVSKRSFISGNVVIEEGAVVMEGANIKGPCFIGKNSYIGTNALLRDSVSIGESCVIGSNMEVKNSVILDGTTTHSGFIGDSVIGNNVKIAAYFCSGNVRLDRESVKVKMPKGEIDSQIRSLGVLMGSRVNVGIRVSTMPGITIGNDAVIGPGTTVMKNIDGNVRYYTKFKEIIEKKKESRPEADQPMVEKKIVLFDVDYTLFDTDAFKKSNLTTYTLFEETLDAILALKQFADIGIFSEGETDFQKTKLAKTELAKHFIERHVHIVESKDVMLKEILMQYKDRDIFLVDDKLNILHLAKKLIPTAFTIWVERGPYAESQKPIEGFHPDGIVKNLAEIISIIKNN